MSSNAVVDLQADVGIVGAGPGGMAAAVELARQGLSVTILDEGMRAGGQIFRQLPDGYSSPDYAEPPSHERGHSLLHDLDASSVRVVTGAAVWDAEPGKLWFESDGRSGQLTCKAIVLAPGAYDRFLPFPGWTLPGVISAGAAQVMVRGFAVRPGQRALVAGTGPLLLPTVTALLSIGVEVVAALEAAPRSAMLRALPGVLRSGARLREAWYYVRQLMRRGVRLQWGHTIFAAKGEGRVQSVVVGRVDRQGRPMRDTARSLEVDTVCAGFGLVPSVELAQRLGCEVEWNAVRGGWCVPVDSVMRTAVDSVYAVGEIAGIGGSEVAIAEGQLAAASVLQALRQQPVPPRAIAARRSQRRAADSMLRAFPVLPGLFDLADDETVVCRCEDVTVRELRDARELYGSGARAIKMGCRAGMGPCQARICGPNLQACAQPGASRDLQSDAPVVQVPVKPVRASTVLGAGG